MNSVFNPKNNLQAFREQASFIKRHRLLIIEMAKREITDRYAGQFFGVFWAIGHPLVLMLVYAFIFGIVFKVKVGGTADLPLNYTTYLLSGLIPWLAFIESMSKATNAIVGNASLLKQFIFPIEVLPIKGVFSTLVTNLIFLFLLIMYILISQHVAHWTFLLLPLLIVLQTMAMIGISYILAAAAVHFRDMKDVIQVFSITGVYLIPAFFLPEFVPRLFQPILYINPFSYLIWCYQDALYFGRFEHPWAWGVVFVLSLSVFTLGYRFFRKVKNVFGDVL